MKIWKPDGEIRFAIMSKMQFPQPYGEYGCHEIILNLYSEKYLLLC